jgi:hypothetical protein
LPSGKKQLLSRDVMNGWRATMSGGRLLGDTRHVVLRNHHQGIKYFNVKNYVN